MIWINDLISFLNTKWTRLFNNYWDRIFDFSLTFQMKIQTIYDDDDWFLLNDLASEIFLRWWGKRESASR